MFYRALVEATADHMDEEGIAHRVPSDSLTRAVALGFTAVTFEADVLEELETRRTPADPRQATLPLA